MYLKHWETQGPLLQTVLSIHPKIYHWRFIPLAWTLYPDVSKCKCSLLSESTVSICGDDGPTPISTRDLHLGSAGACGKPWTRVLVIRGRRPLEGRVQQLPGFNLPSELNCVCARDFVPKSWPEGLEWSGEAVKSEAWMWGAGRGGGRG